MASGSRPAKGAAAAIQANRSASPRRGGQRIANRTVRGNENLTMLHLGGTSRGHEMRKGDPKVLPIWSA